MGGGVNVSVSDGVSVAVGGGVDVGVAVGGGVRDFVSESVAVVVGEGVSLGEGVGGGVGVFVREEVGDRDGVKVRVIERGTLFVMEGRRVTESVFVLDSCTVIDLERAWVLVGHLQQSADLEDIAAAVVSPLEGSTVSHRSELVDGKAGEQVVLRGFNAAHVANVGSGAGHMNVNPC